MSHSEPHNPFYLLLLIAGMVFVVTALAYAVVPVLEEKAAAAGEMPPPSPWRDALRASGWKWLLWELAAVFLFGILSMVLDRLRSLKKERAAATIQPSQTSQGNS
jgi:hypothetical protein